MREFEYTTIDIDRVVILPVTRRAGLTEGQVSSRRSRTHYNIIYIA